MKNLITVVMITAFTGCSVGELTIASCEKYENGICVNAKTEKLKECKEPFEQDGKVYCH